jgi:hypothetical protein
MNQVDDFLTIGKILLPAAFGSAVTWTTTRATQRRADTKAARASLTAAYQQLVRELIAFTVARDAHDNVRIGKSGRNTILQIAAVQGIAAFIASERATTTARVFSAAPATARAITDWRLKVDEASLTALAPAFINVSNAAVPLVTGKDARVSGAAAKLMAVVRERPTDDEALNAALAVVRDAVLAATATPPSRWRRALPSGGRAAIEAPHNRTP